MLLVPPCYALCYVLVVGTYGAALGLSSPSCTGLCASGCECPERSSGPCTQPCPKGFWCLAGVKLPCPPGTYNDKVRG